MVKTYFRNYLGLAFFIISLLVGAIYCLLIVLTSRFENLSALLTTLLSILAVNTFITLLTYWLALREDIKNTNHDRFVRTKWTILVFVVISTMPMLLIFVDFYEATAISYVYIMLAPISLSFSAICLTVFILITTWRIIHNIKVFKLDIVFILFTVPYLWIISFLSFAFAGGITLR